MQSRDFKASQKLFNNYDLLIDLDWSSTKEPPFGSIWLLLGRSKQTLSSAAVCSSNFLCWISEVPQDFHNHTHVTSLAILGLVRSWEEFFPFFLTHKNPSKADRTGGAVFGLMGVSGCDHGVRTAFAVDLRNGRRRKAPLQILLPEWDKGFVRKPYN